MSEHYITDIKTTPDIDLNKVKVKVETDDNRYSDKFEVKVFEGGRLVAVGTSINGLPVEVSMPADAKLWSPVNHSYIRWKFLYLREENG